MSVFRSVFGICSVCNFKVNECSIMCILFMTQNGTKLLIDIASGCFPVSSHRDKYLESAVGEFVLTFDLKIVGS